MARKEETLKYKVNQRSVEIKAYDTVGVEDAYNVLFRAAFHKQLTSEDLYEPIPREIKDWIIKTNLVI